MGLKEYQQKYPFDPSLLVHFRKRFGMDILLKITEWLIEADNQDKAHDKSDDDDGNNGDGAGGSGPQEYSDGQTGKQENRGKLILDATCAPADIHYPIDLGLLNDAREKSEEIIDALYDCMKGKAEKPRTYRQLARKEYLNVAKSKKPRYKAIRRGIKKQLQYLRRNLKSIEWQAGQIIGELPLAARQWKDLRVIHEIYRQQGLMYRQRSTGHRGPDSKRDAAACKADSTWKGQG